MIDREESPVRHSVLLAFFAAFLLAAGCNAEPPPRFAEGVHYQVLPEPVPTAHPDKIEVTEVFWYGCGHCFHFEPLLERWAERLPEDVVLERSPAMWDRGGLMRLHGAIYYTARALGVLDRIHPAAFRALNVESKRLASEEEIAALFEAQGVSREAFARAFHSFAVQAAVRQAEARQRAYRIQGTPELIVEGRWRIAAEMAGSHERMLEIADFLIERARRERVAQTP